MDEKRWLAACVILSLWHTPHIQFIFCEEGTEPLAAAEIPDWLKSMAPTEEEVLKKDDTAAKEDDFSGFFANREEDTTSEETTTHPNELNAFIENEAEQGQNQPLSVDDLYSDEKTEEVQEAVSEEKLSISEEPEVFQAEPSDIETQDQDGVVFQIG